MKSVAKRKEDAIEKLTPKRSPSLDEMLDEALDETFPASDPVALTAPRRPSRTRAGAEKTRGEKGNLRRAPKALRRTVDEGREKCRCVTELTTRRGGPSVHGRSLYDKIVGQRAKVRSVGYPSRGTANRILIEARRRRL